MGLMRFVVPQRDRLPPDAAQRAYFTGVDELPWQSRTQWTDEGLAVRRIECDSGNFHIPWYVAGHGEMMLSTGSLMERDESYHLPVELARGTINRIRNQIAAWEPAGLILSEHFTSRLTEAVGHMARAATSQHFPEVAAERADEAIAVGLDAMSLLNEAYTEQILAVRRRQAAKVVTVLGVNIGSTPLKDAARREVLSAFNAVSVPLVWRDIEANEGRQNWAPSDRQIEWARSSGLKICGGPLLQWDRWSLPDWLYLWEGDEENLRSFIAEHIRAVVARYRGKVNLWQCAARLNVADCLSLSEEERLRLAVLAIETTRAADPRVPVVISIDQPWAEFMGRRECDLAPLVFADALVRADLGLAGIGLEINLGYAPDGTQPRDVLDISRQLDRWSCLGLPLLVNLTIPSAAGKDPHARTPSAPVSLGAESGPTGETQRAWVAELLPLLMAKQPVQGIIWNQLADGAPHDYPFGGLLDGRDQPKPALAALRELRKKFLE